MPTNRFLKAIYHICIIGVVVGLILKGLNDNLRISFGIFLLVTIMLLAMSINALIFKEVKRGVQYIRGPEVTREGILVLLGLTLIWTLIFFMRF